MTRLEVSYQSLAHDVAESKKTLNRVATIVQTFSDNQQANRVDEEKQYRRVANRMRWLTVVIAIAAVAVPVVSALLHIT